MLSWYEQYAGGTVVHQAFGFFAHGSFAYYIGPFEQLTPSVVNALEQDAASTTTNW
jgi:hypothetical protein